MLRKKNITLNGKKAEGREKLAAGDRVSLFFSEETFKKLRGEARTDKEYRRAYRELPAVPVIYENEHILLLNKPAGMLTQKAENTDISLNEWMIGYLLEQGSITENTLQTYRPSVCNRLDRNTSGIVICAKTLPGSQQLTAFIRERKIRKFYRLFVKGRIEKEEVIEGYLVKDALTNTVSISREKKPEASYIQTRYYPLKNLDGLTYLEVELMTGKTHQIRAHLASIGHPLLMDDKYGDKKLNDSYRGKIPAKGQLLHAYRLEFPADEPLLAGGKHIFTAPEPAAFQMLLQENVKKGY
jgi:23S rRNA pseudouridine955/2504/2580 synthase